MGIVALFLMVVFYLLLVWWLSSAVDGDGAAVGTSQLVVVETDDIVLNGDGLGGKFQ